MNKQPTKRKYNPKKMVSTKRRQTKSITSKFAAKKKTREIHTVDILFPQVYVRAYIPDSLSGVTFNDAPLIQNLVRVQQGAGIPNRIGNKIALKSLRLRGSVQTTGVTTGIQQQARFMIVYDRQVNGVYPTVSNVLSDINTSNVVTPGNYLSSINPNFYDRFIVLCDKIFIVGAVTTGGTELNGPTEQKGFIIDEFIKLKGLECQFGTSTNTSPIADLNTGALYLITWGDIINGNEPTYMDMTCRLRFYDN